MQAILYYKETKNFIKVLTRTRFHLIRSNSRRKLDKEPVYDLKELSLMENQVQSLPVKKKNKKLEKLLLSEWMVTRININQISSK